MSYCTATVRWSELTFVPFGLLISGLQLLQTTAGRVNEQQRNGGLSGLSYTRKITERAGSSTGDATMLKLSKSVELAPLQSATCKHCATEGTSFITNMIIIILNC